MSADLFAEFANNPPTTQHSTSADTDPFFNFGSNGLHQEGNASPIERWPSLQTPSVGLSHWTSGSTADSRTGLNLHENDDEDGWGDFETAEPAVPTPSASKTAFGGLTSSAADSGPKVRLVRASTLDLMTNTLVDVGQDVAPKTMRDSHFSHHDAPGERPKPRIKPTRHDSSVLFDAADFELQDEDDDDDENDYDQDEFGAFETGAPASSPKKAEDPSVCTPPAPLLDLLSLDDPPSQPQTKPTTQEDSPSKLLGALSFGAYSTKKQKPKSASPITLERSVEQGEKSPDNFGDGNDDWGPWDHMPKGGDGAKEDMNVDAHDHWDWDAGDTQTATTSLSADEPPPTNVPPPSVILSMFPDLLASGNAFLKKLYGQNASVRQKVVSCPETVNFLRGYILLATTAARVIAGRKHRWHRDKLLAKSMSISAAGSKGMKLAGIDKTQSAKEDREVTDVVAIWHEQIGRLRSAVTAANAAGGVGLKVPELSKSMQVQAAKMVPTSTKACVICGLKREERIAKVDYDVEDSFGEWWTEHWGHRSCKNFWTRHEREARQR